MALYAEYVKLLAEHEGFAQVDLVGHSMGGPIVLAVAEALAAAQ